MSSPPLSFERDGQRIISFCANHAYAQTEHGDLNWIDYYMDELYRIIDLDPELSPSQKKTATEFVAEFHQPLTARTLSNQLDSLHLDK